MDIDKQSGISRFTPLEAQIISGGFKCEGSGDELAVRQKVAMHLMDWARSVVEPETVARYSGTPFGGAHILGPALAKRSMEDTEPEIDVHLRDEELRTVRNISGHEAGARRRGLQVYDAEQAEWNAGEDAMMGEESAAFDRQHIADQLQEILICNDMLDTIDEYFKNSKQ